MVCAIPPVATTMGPRERPLGLDPGDNAVDGVGGAEHHARSDALLGAAPDHTRRVVELRRRQLRSPSDQRFDRRPSRQGAITPPRNTPSAVMQSYVVAVPRSTTIVSRLILAARRECVDDAIGADGERLVDVERDRELGPPASTISGAPPDILLTAFAQIGPVTAARPTRSRCRPPSRG